MQIKKTVLDKFNTGELSISMKGCCKVHFDALFKHMFNISESSDEWDDSEALPRWEFYHKEKGKTGIHAWTEKPQNKDSLHYSKIWEDGDIDYKKNKIDYSKYIKDIRAGKLQFYVIEGYEKEQKKVIEEVFRVDSNPYPNNFFFFFDTPRWIDTPNKSIVTESIYPKEYTKSISILTLLKNDNS